MNPVRTIIDYLLKVLRFFWSGHHKRPRSTTTQMTAKGPLSPFVRTSGRKRSFPPFFGTFRPLRPFAKVKR